MRGLPDNYVIPSKRQRRALATGSPGVRNFVRTQALVAAKR